MPILRRKKVLSRIRSQALEKVTNCENGIKLLLSKYHISTYIVYKPVTLQVIMAASILNKVKTSSYN